MQPNDREVFNDYIWEHYINFLMTPGNHEKCDDGLRLRDGIEFQMKDIPNPNPRQVPDDLWMEILMNHLEQNYN